MGTNWAVFIVLYPCFVAICTRSINPTCNSQDLKALEGFLGELDSPIDGWGSYSNSSDCCNWDGILCEFVSEATKDANMSMRVVRLDLTSRRLKGKLSKSLAALDYLRVLNLSSNFLTNSLPMELFHFEYLEVLNLSSNYFDGNLTIQINLPSLVYLDLSQNRLLGSLHGDICGFAKRLRVLDLSKNHFTGEIPATIGSCSLLEDLSLGSNFLAGNLPEDLFRLPMLRRLNLRNNRLSGLLSHAFGNLSNIVELDLSSNGFSGIFPDAFYNLQKLKRFSANSNGFTGPLPPSLSSCPSISTLSLGNNSLNGSIILNCSAMVRLTSLDLGSNLFSGPIPENLSSCQSLTTLNLSRNKISSQLPETFNNLTSLSYLYLSNCSLQNLSAALTVLQHCKNLSVLVLTINFHREVMPADLDLQLNNLKTLVIANCRLTGVVPTWLSGCTKLELLDLSWNRLSGTIPEFFSHLKFLFYLDLSNNTLSEGIPKGLTKLQSLIYQNITLEEPSFDFPIFIRRSPSSRGLQYNKVRSFPPSLDLSSNFLTGPILAEFGNLKQLHVLKLENNNLSGPIPYTLSGINGFETLDLSHNNLSGTIPRSLVKLSFLSKFSVAYNQLSGSIPTGGQFPTFPDSSFEGNIHLCKSLLTPCLLKPREDLGSNAVESPEGEESIIGLPFAFGLATGFIIVVTILFLFGWVFPQEKVKKRIEIAWDRMM